MRREILVLLLLLVTMAAAAQGRKISGRVVDAEGKPLMSVSVLLLNDKGGHVKFAKTDSKGNFSLSLPDGVSASKISFNSVGYSKRTLNLDNFLKGDKVMKMAERVQTLREVEVKPVLFRVKGDTIIYSVAGLREKQDRTIEDVIARIPGIKVDINGKITYKNAEISKFYVDGKDVTGDRYAMISKNLSADKVDSVEVLQHHQPINALRGKSFSEATALNLVLKPGARGQWNGTLDVGLGYALQRPWNWNHKIRLAEMFFGLRLQSVSMYKHNNTAEDVAAEVGYYSHSLVSSPLNNLISIGRQRYGFNNSHMLATNWHLNGKGNSEWRLQITGLWDKSTSHSYSEQTYLDIGDTKVMSQDRRANAYVSDWNAELYYNFNGNHFHFSNTLQGNLNFDHSTAETRLNGAARRERVLPRKRSVCDNISMTIPTGQARQTVSSTINYAYFPGILRLYNGTDETLNMKALEWNLEHRMDFSVGGKWSFSMTTSYKMKRNNEFVAYNDTIGAVRYQEDQVKLEPFLQCWAIKKVNFKLSCDLTWLSRRLDTDVDNRLYATPDVGIEWRPARLWKLSAGYSHSFSPSGFEMNALRTYTSYNYASSGSGVNNHSTGDYAKVNFAYGNMGAGWNASVGYSYGRTKFSTLYESVLNGGVYVREIVGGNNVSETQSVNVGLSKSFDTMRTRVSLSGSYKWSGYDYLYNKEICRSAMRNIFSYFSLSMRPCRIFNLVEKSTFSFSRQNSVSRSTIYRNFFHTLDLFLTPGKFVAGMKSDCRHSADNSEKFSLYSSAYVSYKTQQYELRLDLNNLWGTNKREYKSVSVLGTSYSVTELRPREFLASVSFSL